MFLFIVDHNTRQRIVGDRFQLLLETIHRRFCIVLHSIHALGAILIKSNENYNGLPAKLRTNNKYFPWFEVTNEFLLAFNFLLLHILNDYLYYVLINIVEVYKCH